LRSGAGDRGKNSQNGPCSGKFLPPSHCPHSFPPVVAPDVQGRGNGLSHKRCFVVRGMWQAMSLALPSTL
jgi:hypothetical protein